LFLIFWCEVSRMDCAWLKPRTESHFSIQPSPVIDANAMLFVIDSIGDDSCIYLNCAKLRWTKWNELSDFYFPYWCNLQFNLTQEWVAGFVFIYDNLKKGIFALIRCEVWNFFLFLPALGNFRCDIDVNKRLFN
jgi:hypothetical protein